MVADLVVAGAGRVLAAEMGALGPGRETTAYSVVQMEVRAKSLLVVLMVQASEMEQRFVPQAILNAGRLEAEGAVAVHPMVGVEVVVTTTVAAVRVAAQLRAGEAEVVCSMVVAGVGAPSLVAVVVGASERRSQVRVDSVQRLHRKQA